MTYKVTYKSSQDGDCCSVWTEASDPQQAASNVRDEYWAVYDEMNKFISKSPKTPIKKLPKP